MTCAAPCDHVLTSKIILLLPPHVQDGARNCLVADINVRLSVGSAVPAYCQKCASEHIQCQEVDFILGQTYKEINLDETLASFPNVAIFTLWKI